MTSPVAVDIKDSVILPLAEYRRLMAIVTRYEVDRELEAYLRREDDDGDGVEEVEETEGLALPGYRRGGAE